jgi:iron complex outermembrane receptor protein
VSLFSPEVEVARAAQITDVRGNVLPKTPRLTGNIALIHTTAIEGWGDVKSSLSFTYRGDFKHRVFNNPTTDSVPSYQTLDVLVKLTPDDADWRVELIGKNITDEAGINARFTDVFGVGATGDQFIQPRQFMVRAGFDF